MIVDIPVHLHRPDEGPGLDCPEYEKFGRPFGRCVLEEMGRVEVPAPSQPLPQRFAPAVL